MTDQTLAEELEAHAVDLETFYSSRPDRDAAPAFAEKLRKAARALREREVMREALEDAAVGMTAASLLIRVAFPQTASDLSELANASRQIARAALQGGGE